MMRLSRFSKNSSRLLRDQIGTLPPALEICHLPPGPGNGRTYTSYLPDSSDWYAIQRPSGETAG